MTDNRRRLAADARRLSRRAGSPREVAAEIRESLRLNYERGLDDGRLQERDEAGAMHPTSAILVVCADSLSAARALSESIPNADRVAAALREAEAILRDAAGLKDRS